MSDGDPPSGRRHPSRRDLLTLAGSAIVGGLAGCSVPGVGGDLGSPTPAQPPDEVSDRVASFEPLDPRMQTPWTDDVDPRNPRPEYPRPQLTRQRWRSLNGVWEFAPVGADEDPPIGETLSEDVLVPFPVESPISGIGRHEPRMWYRRTVSIPDDWSERVLLHFEAVDFDATVHVNGEEVGRHEGAYDPFALDVTDALDGSGEAELVVGVVDPTDTGQQPLGKQRLEPEGIYYTSCSGIWGSVWLEPVPETYVADLDLSPDVDGERVRLTVATEGSEDGSVRVTALDDGDIVGTVEGNAGEELSLPIPDPHLWTPDDPFLYDVEVELVRDGDVVDAVRSYVGMRSVGMRSVNGTQRLTLNGEVVFHMGTLDQGYWPDGIYTAPTDEALRFDLAVHEEMGFNAVRKHVKVEPRRWYHWADQLGLLVWQDMPSSAVRAELPTQDSREQFETEMHRMIDTLKNHPSVVAWVPFNEGWGSFDVPGIVDLIRTEDPTRLVDAHSGIEVCRGAGRICGPGTSGDVVDLHTYPGPGRVTSDENRVGVLGEYGGVGLQVEDHLWNPDEEYAYASTADGVELTADYVDRLDRVRRYARGCSSLAGAFYTQLTDVEREINGLVTYDRQVTKVDVATLHGAHERLYETIDEIEEREPTDASDEPAAHWPLDDGEGETATDAVGDHDAALRNLLGDPPQWTDGKVGGAISFDGTRDVLDAGGPVVDTSGPFGVAAWVRLSEPYKNMVAVSQDESTESAFALGYAVEDDRFVFEIPGTRVVGGPAVEGDRWYHIAATVSGCHGSVRLYVDGEDVAAADSAPPPTSEGNTVIGRGKTNGAATEYWDGVIDEVYVYQGAITAEQVARLADAD